MRGSCTKWILLSSPIDDLWRYLPTTIAFFYWTQLALGPRSCAGGSPLLLAGQGRQRAHASPHTNTQTHSHTHCLLPIENERAREKEREYRNAAARICACVFKVRSLRGTRDWRGGYGGAREKRWEVTEHRGKKREGESGKRHWETDGQHGRKEGRKVGEEHREVWQKGNRVEEGAHLEHTRILRWLYEA